MSMPVVFVLTPESVGLNNTNLVLGKHSGRAAFNDRMQDLGFQVHCDSLSTFYIASWLELFPVVVVPACLLT